MWRTCVSLVVAMVPAAAQAGALAEVVSGISRASDNDDHDTGSGGGDGDGDTSSSGIGLFDYGCCRGGAEGTVTYGAPPPQAPLPGTRTEVYAGVQSVDGSDGSLTLEVRAIHDDFEVGVRGTSFYERAGADEYLHLDLWWLGGGVRVTHTDRTELWAELGLAGINNNDELSMTGWAGGGRLTHRLDGELAVEATVRHFSLEDDVTATEAAVGLHVAVLRLSYRVVDFNVGPPLQGPEVGVALRF
jgi:hypothetical protein